MTGSAGLDRARVETRLRVVRAVEPCGLAHFGVGVIVTDIEAGHVHVQRRHGRCGLGLVVGDGAAEILEIGLDRRVLLLEDRNQGALAQVHCSTVGR